MNDPVVTSDANATPPLPAVPKIGRPTALGPQQRKRILTLLTAGCSRRTAAKSVGCSPSTIWNTLRRDPQFAQEVAQAESNLESDLVQSIRDAAKSGRYWRAAGWLLERKFALDYTSQSPDCYALDQVIDIFQSAVDTIHDDLTPEQCDRIFGKLTELLGIE